MNNRKGVPPPPPAHPWIQWRPENTGSWDLMGVLEHLMDREGSLAGHARLLFGGRGTVRMWRFHNADAQPQDSNIHMPDYKVPLPVTPFCPNLITDCIIAMFITATCPRPPTPPPQKFEPEGPTPSLPNAKVNLCKAENLPLIQCSFSVSFLWVWEGLWAQDKEEIWETVQWKCRATPHNNSIFKRLTADAPNTELGTTKWKVPSGPANRNIGQSDSHLSALADLT